MYQLFCIIDDWILLNGLSPAPLESQNSLHLNLYIQTEGAVDTKREFTLELTLCGLTVARWHLL